MYRIQRRDGWTQRVKWNPKKNGYQARKIEGKNVWFKGRYRKRVVIYELDYNAKGVQKIEVWFLADRPSPELEARAAEIMKKEWKRTEPDSQVHLPESAIKFKTAKVKGHVETHCPKEGEAVRMHLRNNGKWKRQTFR